MGRVVRQRLTCYDCGKGFTYKRKGAGRPPMYCPDCGYQRQLAWSREGMADLRQRRRAEEASLYKNRQS